MQATKAGFEKWWKAKSTITIERLENTTSPFAFARYVAAES